MQVWTEQARKAAGDRVLARWADPEYKVRVGKAISRPAKCNSCGETDINKFYVDGHGRRTNKICKECHKQKMKEKWHSTPPLDRWASRASGTYGVSKEFLLDLRIKQDGKCAICGEAPKTARGLHVDHCHKTGAVRGLLCHGCNVGIGALRDDPEIISKALSYLKG